MGCHTVYNTVDIFVLASQYLSHSAVPDRAAHRCRWFLSMSSCRRDCLVDQYDGDVFSGRRVEPSKNSNRSFSWPVRNLNNHSIAHNDGLLSISSNKNKTSQTSAAYCQNNNIKTLPKKTRTETILEFYKILILPKLLYIDSKLGLLKHLRPEDSDQTI